MGVKDLNRDQLIELKQHVLMGNGEVGVSYGELAEADTLISDEEVFERYAIFSFSEDDFACSCNQSR